MKLIGWEDQNLDSNPHPLTSRPIEPSRFQDSTGGEVHGSHIVRSTGRKDRHSKVCTAKGLRDRRVRLAAHTAIQFYDVQDRLGYDRPSKAVDWLINKAKSAIDDLAHLPALHSPDCATAQQLRFRESKLGIDCGGDDEVVLNHRRTDGNFNSNSKPDSSFHLPAAEINSSDVEFQSFHNQDLRLSLQSLHDPILLQHHNPSLHRNPNSEPEQSQILLSGTPLGFNGNSTWSAESHPHHRQQQSELSRFHHWNSGGDGGGVASAASGYLLNPPPPLSAPQPLLQQMLGHNSQFLSQRGPLQSSNTPSVRAWIDQSAVADHHIHYPGALPTYHHPPSMSAIGFPGCRLPGFHIPAQIQGGEEKQDGYSEKPSSASSDSHH